MISGFRSDVDDICAFLGCYAGCRFKLLGRFHGRHRQGGQEIQKESHSLVILLLFWGNSRPLEEDTDRLSRKLVKFTATLCVTSQKNAALEAKSAS